MALAASRIIKSAKRFFVVALVLATSGFALYTGGAGPFEAPLQRGIFLLLMLPLVFLTIPSGLFRREVAEDAFGLLLAALAIGVMTWNAVNFVRLYSSPFLSVSDILIGAAGLIIVLESVRRTVGLAITLIFAGFLVYGYFGGQIPISALRVSGLDVETTVSTVFYGTYGVFGTAVGVAATFIILVVILGALLTASGGAEFFMNIAKSLAGRFTGGPAKVAVIGSALMGMITGSTVANVATVGSVTIPMMKRSGYERHFAAAVEALASCGGQLMPPIMGAAAFLMTDYLNIDYFEVMRYAVVPALLYFFTIFCIVHVHSARKGFRPLPQTEMPDLWQEVKARGHMLLPVVALVILLSYRLDIMYAAFFAVVGSMVTCMLRPATRLNLRGFYGALEDAMRAMCPLAAICAGAGILIGVLTATGLSLKITYLIQSVANGSLFITLLMTMVACIILGMGLPTVAAYVVLATLIPASMVKLGVVPVAAHMFIFYFAILSAITPPVCIGAYVAAGIADANPMKVGITAIRLGVIAVLLPFAFVYNPSLLLIGTPMQIAFSIGTALLGILYWAFGLEGYFARPLGVYARVMLIIAGALLVWPELWVSIAGFAIGTSALVPAFLTSVVPSWKLRKGSAN